MDNETITGSDCICHSYKAAKLKLAGDKPVLAVHLGWLHATFHTIHQPGIRDEAVTSCSGVTVKINRL